MVYIVLTEKGLDDILQSAVKPKEIWLNGGVANGERLSQLRADRWSISSWTSPFDPEDLEQLDGAISTVREHHPDDTIWLEIGE
jgi:hypothetical protein